MQGVQQKAQVHYCDHGLPIVDNILDFCFETAEQNSTKLDKKQDLNVLYQVCVFQPIRNLRWPPWPLIGWDIFDLELLWNCWTEFNET